MTTMTMVNPEFVDEGDYEETPAEVLDEQVVEEETDEEETEDEPTEEEEESEETAYSEAFASELQKHFKINPEDISKGIQQLASVRLQQEWDLKPSEFDERMALIKTEFDKLSPELQKSLDNNEGAKFIWDKLDKRKSTKKPDMGKRKTVPIPSNTDEETFTQDQIEKMSAEEYSKNVKKIERAYAAGKVK